MSDPRQAKVSGDAEFHAGSESAERLARRALCAELGLSIVDVKVS